MIGIAAVVIAGGVLLFKSDPGPTLNLPADPGKLVRDSSHMTGDKAAKVTLVEFGDYECPFCASLNPTIEQIVTNYVTDKNFNFVFRNFPLSQHQNAKIAAEAAEAAGAQGKFWEMNKKIYASQNDWSGQQQPLETFVNYAKALNLDTAKFRDEVQHNTYDTQIETDLNDGNALNVNGTPTLYLNGQLIQATSDYNNLKSEIDALLKK